MSNQICVIAFRFLVAVCETHGAQRSQSLPQVCPCFLFTLPVSCTRPRFLSTSISWASFDMIWQPSTISGSETMILWWGMVHNGPYQSISWSPSPSPNQARFLRRLFFPVASLGLPRVGGDAKSQVGPAMVNGGWGQGLEIYGKYGLNIWTMYIHVLCQQADSCLCSVVLFNSCFPDFVQPPVDCSHLHPCLGSVALRPCAANIAECPDRANSWDLGSCSQTNTCRTCFDSGRPGGSLDDVETKPTFYGDVIGRIIFWCLLGYVLYCFVL